MQLFNNILSSFTLLFSRMNSIFPSLPSKAKGQRSSSTSSMSSLRSAASASDGPWFRNMRHWPVEAATSEAGHFPPLGNVTLNAHKICECVWNCMEVSVWPKWFCMTEMINYVCDCLCIPAGYSKRILSYSYSLKKLAKKLFSDDSRDAKLPSKLYFPWLNTMTFVSSPHPWHHRRAPKIGAAPNKDQATLKRIGSWRWNWYHPEDSRMFVVMCCS